MVLHIENLNTFSPLQLTEIILKINRHTKYTHMLVPTGLYTCGRINFLTPDNPNQVLYLTKHSV